MKIYNFFIGIFIGCGAILPGVSSGVFCVIFGIYEKLVDSIVNFFKDFKKNIVFLLPIALGVFVGVVLFGNIIKYVFTKFEAQARFAFIGLILGTIPALLSQATNNCNSFNNRKGKFVCSTISLKKILPMIISFLVGIALIILEKILNLDMTLSTAVNNPIYLVFAGVLMSIGIVVPGISNTVILMCLGVYSTYISAVASVDLRILVPLGIGVLCGGFVWLKIVEFLLNRYHEATFYAIIGFTLGSVFVLLPKVSLGVELLLNIILLLFSMFLSYKLSKYS